jgi:4-hydroxybenzoate polyprenyltransferase
MEPTVSPLPASSSPGDAGEARAVAGGRSVALAMVRACRPHQWMKNCLLFVPLILSHRIREAPLVMKFITAFLAFGLTASGVYVVNDLIDREADRKHPTKRLRPFASGALKPREGLLLAPALLVGALGLSLALLPLKFTGALGLYLAITFAYSAYAKRLLFIDVLCLASLYTLRIVAGTSLDELLISEWLLAFSVFFFLSLSLVKRYTELLLAADDGASRVEGRGYVPADIDIVRSLGINCGVISVLVFALYIASGTVLRMYRRPDVVWLICPVLLYWIGRVWFLAARKEMPHDPVVFALSDRNSYLAGLAVALLLAIAS